MGPGSEFPRLVRSAQGGDPDATERLLAELRPYLEMVTRDYADPSKAVESASDLVQESWLRVWRSLATFTGGADDAETHAKFRVWVAQIARRVGIDARRIRYAKRRTPEGRMLRIGGAGSTGQSPAGGGVDPPARGNNPSAGVHLDERTRLVHSALGRIPDAKDREIVRLHFFEALSLREVSARLGLSYDQVKDRYRTSMKRLERELGRYL